jgi:4-hydroxy-tetrahydrodipicolinate synthase
MTRLQGCGTALVTPFTEDGLVDFPALRALVDWQIAEGIDFLVACGSTGEAQTLNESERERVVASVVEVAGGRVPVMAGATSNDTARAVDEVQRMCQLGADYILTATPYYNKPTQEGLYRHFRKIAESVDLPMILYNVPGRTVADLANDTVLRLAQVPGIIGIKDATANIERGTDLIKRLPRHFAVYSGEDATALALILLGGHGVISVTANVAPKLMHQMCAAALVGDVKRAREINLRLLGLHQRLFVEANPIPVKWALAEMGKIEPGLRLPLAPLSEKFHQAVREALHEAGIALPGLRVVEGRA